MAKKKEGIKPHEEEKEELIPVLLPNGCVSHWIKKPKE